MNHAHKKIIIPGGTGFIGRHVAAHFHGLGWEVVVLSRSGRSMQNTRVARWDGKTVGEWASQLEGADAVLNLAGRTVNCRYHERNKQQVYRSRLDSTRAIGEAIAQRDVPPPVWLNSSSATFYRHALDRPMDEATGELGTVSEKGPVGKWEFSIDVCRKWEQVLEDAPTPDTRKVALRSAMTFGRGSGGVFHAFRWLAKLGLGGTLGPGSQYVSWIHIDDFNRAIEWLIANGSLTGAVNVAAPNPLPNHEFMRHFREACGMPLGLRAWSWMLEIGAFFLRTETELLLKSRRVVPGRLLNSGFEFRFPHFPDAIRDLAGR